MIDKQTKKEMLYKKIKNMKNLSWEEMILITRYSLISYLKSLLVFGRKSGITRDNLNIIKEMAKILKLERKMFNFILRYIDDVDINATREVIYMLDELNSKTIEYYYKVIDDIEDAAETKDERRGTRINKDFPTLIQSVSYAVEVISLIENNESIKEFLGLSKEFWEYIENKVEEIDFNNDIDESIYKAEPICNDEGLIIDMKIIIPKIVDINSASICVKVYEKAYQIYSFKMLNKVYKNKNIDYSLLQQDYKKKYLPEKAQKILIKRWEV